jgi:hypothetical protein
MDREYFQVITAITISDASKLWDVNSLQTFPNVINSGSVIRRMRHLDVFVGYDQNGADAIIYPKDTFEGWNDQFILILQRGVDPYSPKYTNEYNLGKIFGYDENNSNFIVTANTRVNIPIQKVSLGSNTIPTFTPNNIFYESKFFTPGNNFSAFTSTTISYYSGLGPTLQDLNGSYIKTQSFQNANGFITKTSNDFYSQNENPAKYSEAEDLSGVSFIYGQNGFLLYETYGYYYRPQNLYPQFSGNPMSITNKVTNVMRTDRLPSSDQLDGLDWNFNPAVLQQNNNFIFYEITEPEDSTILSTYTQGSQQVEPDIEDEPLAPTVLTSFDCAGMVGLKCYSGNSYSFGVQEGCSQTDYVEKGCYVFVKRPILDLPKDLVNLNEWGYRFRFFYGLCRGVLSQSFVNNWVNGSLYAFPLQVDTNFDKNNQPTFTKRTLIGRKLVNLFCKELVYYDSDTNNIYYRSSPYNWATNSFVGKDPDVVSAINQRNLLYPTTIVNLGPKDFFWGEITLDPSYRGYIIDRLDNTSYGDTSDLVNLFVITRITDESFLQRLFSFGDNSLNQLFSRNGSDRRIDGDLAQLLSINSEEGVVKFSPQFYGSEARLYDPIVVLGTPSKPILGVFFSSTTEDLQFKDYLTPGRIDFRPANNAKAIGYNYGIKSQRVPFYKWSSNGGNSIFGTETNNWKTNYSPNVAISGIFSREYQSLDRTGTTIPSYFITSNAQINDTYARGYIFNVSADTINDAIQYSPYAGNWNSSFLVGAPFHFYFGTVVGASALDRFKSKYSVDE